MLPLKQVTLKVQDQEQKIRYLLGRTEDPWLMSNKDKLNDIITLFSKLASEGLKSDELFEQFAYTNDLVKINDLKQVLLQEYKIAVNQTNPALLAFQHTMSYNMQQYRQMLIEKVDKDYDMIDFPEGIIRITTQPNKMYALKTNTLFESKSETVGMRTIIDESRYYTTFSIGGEVIQIICPYDTVVGLETINNVLNVNDLYIRYKLNQDSYELQQIAVEINLNNVEVDFQTDIPITTMKKVNFQQFISDIPIGVIVYSKMFKETTVNPYDQFYNMLVSSIIEQLSNNVIKKFEDRYSKDITYGLYGQGAMIGVSQVYELAKTAVRAVKSEYSVSTTNPIYSLNPLPNEFPGFDSQITDKTLKNKMNIIGNTAVGELGKMSDSGSLPSVIRIKLDAMPEIVNYKETAGMIKTGYNVASERLTVNKGVLVKYMSDGTTGNAKYWIEFESVAQQATNVVRGTYGIWNNKFYPVQADALATAEFYKYTVHGVQLGYQMGQTINETITIPTVDGYSFKSKIVTTVKLIIWPDDLSSEGTSADSITVTFKRRGDVSTVTSQATKTQIQYGSAQIMVYVVNLDSYSDTHNFVSGAAFDVVIGKKNGNPRYYKRDKDNQLIDLTTTTVKTSFYNVHTSNHEYTLANMGVVGISNKNMLGRCEKPNGIGIKTAYVSTRPDYSVNKFVTPCAPWAAVSDSITTMGWINFKSEYEYVDEGTDWTSLQMVRTFNDAPLETTPEKESGTMKIYFSGGEVRSWDSIPVTNVDWGTGKFPSITTTTYKTYSAGPNVPPNYVITNLDFTVREIVLPSGVLNQGLLSESIITLQRSVEYLQNYASYLAYLIENLDARLTQVEETLQQVVEILQQMMGKNKNVLGVISDIVGFIGTGVGMFFPLIGLGITIIGQVLQGANEINEGDVVTGSMDIVIGGVMAALGVKKYNQRLKRKYGQQDPIPGPNDDLPTYEEVMGKPGYGCISINRNADPTAYGAVRNTWYDFSGDTLVIHGSVYPNTALQMKAENTYGTIKINGIEKWQKSNARDNLYIREGMDFQVLLITMDELANVTELQLNQTDLIFYLGIDVSPEQYAVIMYLYALGSTESFSKSTAFDAEGLDILMISNGVIMNGKTTTKNMVTDSIRKSKRIINKKQWFLKYKNNQKSGNVVYQSPITNVSMIYNATNPLVQSMSDQITMFTQLYNSLFLNVDV